MKKYYIALLAVTSAILWIGAAVPSRIVKVNPTATGMVDPTAAEMRVSMEATTVGSALFKAANPSAIRFIRVNADNSITLLSDSAFKTALNFTSAVPATVGFNSVNAGLPLVTGKRKGYAVASVAGTISKWSISVDTGTVTVKCWKIATGTAVPTIANVINTAGIAISSGTHVSSTTVSDFTNTTVAVGDIFAFDITAISGVTEMSFILTITPT